MKPYRTCRAAIAVGALLTVSFFVPRDVDAQAKETSLEELTQTSSAVVLGRASKKESVWNEKRTQILTEVTIRVDENVKGDLGSEAVITIPGGRIGNMLYEVSDMPVFDEGEQVLVFLWRHPSGKNLITGGAHGKLEIIEDEISGEKKLPAAALLLGEATTAGKAGADRPEMAQSVRLEDVLSLVKRIATQ